ncbi:MAG: hypothetical protein ACKVXR_09355 [Planctomycetota bacterium]
MTCREARSRILPAIDGSMRIERVFELEEHVRGCDDCRARYEEARELDAALARLPEPPADRIEIERAVAGIRGRIEREIAPVRSLPPRRRVSWWVPIGIGALAAAALLVFLLRTSPNEEARAPEVVVEPIPPPPAPTVPPPTAPEILDLARLERARDEVRCLLASDPSPAHEFARRFDDGARELYRTGWPVLRLVEDNLADPDPLVARAAARYLGLRGDRLAMHALENSLANPTTCFEAALALCDAGDAGLDGLVAALREPRASALVVERLAERRDEGSARLLDGAARDAARLRDARGGSARLLAVIDALARIGPAGVPALLRMGSDGTLTRAEVVDALARTDGAADAVADLVVTRPRGIDGDLALTAIAALQPPRALSLLERRCLEEREQRPQALATIARYGGQPGLEILVRLAASGRIPRAEIESPILETLAGERYAGRAVVLDADREGRRGEIAAFQRILSDSPGRDGAPALVALGGSRLLPASDRRWCVLLAGETGVASDADLVFDLFERVRPSEKDVRAACLIAIRALAGVEGLQRFLESLPPRVAERVLALLAASEAKERPASTVSRLSRELEDALAPLAP